MRLENVSQAKIRSFRLLNDKLFSASSTGLTHRQINSLEGNDILRSGRKDKKKWRAFTYKERIFLLIITELRKYGFKDKQLRNLRDAFFKKSNALYSDMVIMEALEENKVVLLVKSNGEVSFHGALHLDENYTSFININLNTIIESLRKEIGAKEKLGYVTDEDILVHVIPSEKERAIVDAIRTGNYESIKIKFKDGKMDLLEKTEKIDPKKRIADVRKEHKFQSITEEEEGGKIVSIKRTSRERL